jgi:hypothetical protein
MFLDLVNWFLSTNMFAQVLETVQRKEKRIRKRIGYEEPTSTQAWHTGLSGAPGWLTMNRLLSGNDRGVRLKFTGLSGGASDCPMTYGASSNGRPHDQRVTHGSLQRSAGCTGLSGAPTSPEEQRSAAPDMEGDRAPDMNSGCPVVHRTVRCTTRQKAGIAFQVGLQRLLAALGL